jgi:hypothetical protein
MHAACALGRATGTEHAAHGTRTCKHTVTQWIDKHVLGQLLYLVSVVSCVFPCIVVKCVLLRVTR